MPQKATAPVLEHEAILRIFGGFVVPEVLFVVELVIDVADVVFDDAVDVVEDDKIDGTGICFHVCPRSALRTMVLGDAR